MDLDLNDSEREKSFPSSAKRPANVEVTKRTVGNIALRTWAFGNWSRLDRGAIPDLLVIAFVALTVVTVFWARLVNHDIAWYLFATRDWMAGSELYVDIVEVNPPLAFYLTVPALRLADLLGVNDEHGHILAVALLLSFSLIWSGRILRSGHEMPSWKRLSFLLGSAIAILIPTLNGLGQREQILVICFLPWALLEASTRPVRQAQILLAALFAAVGMCLKPHFVALPLAVTALNCIETRSFRPILSLSNMVFLAVGSAYVGYVWAVHPAYLFQTAPAAMWVYGAFGRPMWMVLSVIGPYVGLFAILIAVAHCNGSLTREVRIFAVLAAGGFFSYQLQGTGFAYRKVPFLAFTAIASFFLLVPASRTRVTAAIAALTIWAIVVLGFKQGFYSNLVLPEITETVDDIGPVKSLITLSSQIHTGPPIALALDADWASGYPHNWLVPGAVNRLEKTDCNIEVDVCARLEDIAAQNRTANIRDIDRLKPDLLIVDKKSAVFDTPRFDWLAFMSEDPAWTFVFADYRQVAETERFLYYQRARP